ncbi:MAG: hypothetical protein WC856_26145 [Methylococcaceae bacterium]|jgi:hypothetical protein
MSDEQRAILLAVFYAAHCDTLFNQNTVAAVRNCSTATLERDRWAGGGIPFLKINRSVKYRKSDVLAWLAQYQTQNSTSDSEKAA